eukprot:1158188-Pelagomonas_calceolata.AAC.10
MEAASACSQVVTKLAHSLCQRLKCREHRCVGHRGLTPIRQTKSRAVIALHLVLCQIHALKSEQLRARLGFECINDL